MANRFLSLGVLSILVTGCGEATSPPDDAKAEAEGGGDTGTTVPGATPEFEGGGQVAVPEVIYPEGPYGINRKSVVRNYEFLGFSNPSAEGGRDEFQSIQLADFYNPTGKDVYPEGSPFGAGNPKPKALSIVVAARWCGPCQIEAKNVLPGKYLALKPKGGEFLLNLAQDLDYEPAKMSDLRAWTKTYKVNYPSIVDPSQKLSSLFDANAFPANLLINTIDMTVVDVSSGAPPSSYWKKFEELLDGDTTAAE